MSLPYSKALRKRGSFLYMISLLFKEGTEIGKSWIIHISPGEVRSHLQMYVGMSDMQTTMDCFPHSCPLCPISRLGKSWLMRAFSPNRLDQTFHRLKGNCIGLKGLLFRFLLTRNKQKFCLCPRRMQLSRMGDDVNMDFKIKTCRGKHFPVAQCAFPNLRAGYTPSQWRSILLLWRSRSALLFDMTWLAISY